MEYIPEPQQAQKIIHCRYMIEERNAILPFKVEYRGQTTSLLWKQLFRCKILPAIFNHWHDIRKIPENDQESANHIKVLNFLFLYYK